MSQISNFFDNAIPKYAEVVRNSPVETDKHALMSTWFYAPQLGQPRGGTPVSVMRQFAQTPQVAMCIKTIIDEIGGIPYSIVPKKGFEDSFNEQTKEDIEEFLRYPNRNGESFNTIVKALLKDILEIDAGVIVKTFGNYGKEKTYSFTSYIAKDGEYPTVDIIAKALTTRAKLSEIYCRDAGTFVINPNEYGILPEDKPAYFQYSWLNHSAKPLPFFKREIVYFNSTPRSNSPYGWSPIESIFMVLESLNNAVRFNKKSFEENAIPDGALSVIGADKDALQRFIHQWKNDVKGKPHKLVIFNEDMKFTSFHNSNKDMEWLEGQKYYQRLVWAMYGVTPDELGFTETSNRSVGESQSRVFVRRAIKPFLQLLETKITEDIIAEFYDEEIECEIKWDWVDQALEHEEQAQQREDVAAGILTINEVRLGRGLDPVSWGDENPNQPQQQGFGGFDFGDNSFDEFLNEDIDDEVVKFLKKKRKPVRFGPRGGRIIGQDSGGKPIYESKPTIQTTKQKFEALYDQTVHEINKADKDMLNFSNNLKEGNLDKETIKQLEASYRDNVYRSKLKPVIQNFVNYREKLNKPIEMDYQRYGVVKELENMRTVQANEYSKYHKQLRSMSPEEFIKVAPISYGLLSIKSIKFQYEQIKKTGKFPVGFLDVESNKDGTIQVTGHEGRHTAMAARMLGIDKIEVAILADSNETIKSMDSKGLNPQDMSQKDEDIIKRPESLDLPFKEPTGTKWEEWADYGDFLGGYFNQLDKQVLKIFDEEMSTNFKGQKIWLRKDWGGFLAKITSVFAVSGLKEHIEKYIKKTWMSALDEVEDSLNIQIGIGDSDRVMINQFAEQQTEGYVLPDGTKWLGIQGVNDKLQIQIGEIVQKGVSGGLSVDEVRKNIQLKLDTTRNHAMMIARTETNRIRNRAHLGAYMKSNIPGKIKWDAHLDTKTSEVCEELDGKKVSPGDLFITADGQEFAYPPAHVNCRSRIVFVPEILEEFEDESE